MRDMEATTHAHPLPSGERPPSPERRALLTAALAAPTALALPVAAVAAEDGLADLVARRNGLADAINGGAFNHLDTDEAMEPIWDRYFTLEGAIHDHPVSSIADVRLKLEYLAKRDDEGLEVAIDSTMEVLWQLIDHLQAVG